MGKSDGLIIIWPAYFDLDKTRAKGRMVPRSLAVQSPTAEEIYEVCVMMKRSPVLEEKKKIPSATWSRPGRVLIKKEGAKLKTLREIAISLQRKRASGQKK
jgi:signal recognition particle subunit SRP19